MGGFWGGVINGAAVAGAWQKAQQDVKFLDNLLNHDEIRESIQSNLSQSLSNSSWANISEFTTTTTYASIKNKEEIAEILREKTNLLIINTTYAISEKYEQIIFTCEYKLYKASALKKVERMNPPRYDLLKRSKFGKSVYNTTKMNIESIRPNKKVLKLEEQALLNEYESLLKSESDFQKRLEIKQKRKHALKELKSEQTSRRIAIEGSNYKGNLWAKNNGELLKETISEGTNNLVEAVVKKINKIELK